MATTSSLSRVIIKFSKLAIVYRQSWIDVALIFILFTYSLINLFILAESLVSYAGERFDFIVEMNQEVDNYWIRYRGLMDCDERFLSAHQVGILRYNGAQETDPNGTVPYARVPTNTTALVEIINNNNFHLSQLPIFILIIPILIFIIFTDIFSNINNDDYSVVASERVESRNGRQPYGQHAYARISRSKRRVYHAGSRLPVLPVV